MKKFMRIGLTLLVVLMATGLPAYAHGGRGHVGFGVYVGPGWWGWPSPYSYPYYPYYYSQPPVVVERQPDTYIYQAPQKDEPYYWYFCKNPEGYYPYVKKCPSGWLKVVPPAEPEEREE
ncbi:MAG TPA: hypothetical protein VI389_03505 [Geobacteraceae bacterium]